MMVIQKQSTHRDLNYVITQGLTNKREVAGYIGVSNTHPLYSKSSTRTKLGTILNTNISVGIAHWPSNLNDTLWWFGFGIEGNIEHAENVCIKICKELVMPEYLERQLDKLIKGEHS